jgi:hypothetical protein
MPLPDAEAFVYDYIKSNRSIREFWEGKIADVRRSGADDFQAAEQLADMLLHAYATPEAVEELTGLIDQLALMTIDWRRLAAMLLGRDIEIELRATLSKSQSVSPPEDRFFENWPLIWKMQREERAAKRREYESAVRRFKQLEQNIFWVSLLVGVSIAGWWLWMPSPPEFSWTRVGATLLLGLLIAFFVMLLPVWCIEW